jgi:hypothetical protein
MIQKESQFPLSPVPHAVYAMASTNPFEYMLGKDLEKRLRHMHFQETGGDPSFL